MNIAARYNGEIINGDAMQLYSGLPIITNKMPVEERKNIPHHFLGEIGLADQTWTVSTFVSHALEKIKEIRGRGRLPVLVGGTHYYTQSLLFHDALAAQKDDTADQNGSGEKWPILDGPTEDIIAKLREVDPVMADRWHPKDRRKIRRSLEVWLQTGRKASDIYQEQRARREQSSAMVEDNNDDMEPISYLREKTLVLWVNSDSEELTRRLDSRVDKMVKQGLLAEVETLDAFAQQQAAAGETIDMTRGIWVAIGYKEFLEYQTALRREDSSQALLDKLLHEAIEKTKAATRQYAKRQIRWIRIKLSHAVNAAGARDHFFMLDGSDLATWDKDVSNTGLDLVDSFMRGTDLPDPLSLSPLASEMLQPKRHDMSARIELWSRQHCDVCNVTAVTESNWTQHMKSRRHRILTARNAKNSINGSEDQECHQAPKGPSPAPAQLVNEQLARELS